MLNNNGRIITEIPYLIPNFRHVPGVHCTSSAIRDVFEFNYLKISEAMVFGLGSGLALGYGSVVSQHPVIGGRQYKFEDNLCKLLKIKMNKFMTTNKEEGWLRLKKMLENKIPAAINIDMAYLKYHNLPENFRFGQHTVAVCGYNPEKSTVLIADTYFPDIKEISIKDLTTARNSTYNKWMDPRNFIYEFTFPESNPDLKGIIPIAIQRSGKNILKKNRFMRILGMTNGIDAINKFSENLDSLWDLEDSERQERCEEIAGYISEYGTGGGLFRYLFAKFLHESSSICDDEVLLELSKYYKNLGDRWEQVSQNIRRLPGLNKEEVNQVILVIKDILLNIKIFEQKGAQKLQNYSK